MGEMCDSLIVIWLWELDRNQENSGAKVEQSTEMVFKDFVQDRKRCTFGSPYMGDRVDRYGI